jgi:outer membrane receptor protein involved in Fe transport
VSAVYELAEGHNLRGSYQTAFRIPTTQDQYIDLDVVTRRLIGRNQILRDNYNLDTNPVYTTESVALAQSTGNSADLEIAGDVYKEYLTEKVQTYELGYKGLWMGGSLFIDAFYYWSTYNDLLAEIDITQVVVVGADLASPEANGGLSDAEKASVLINGGGTIGGDPQTLQRYGYDVNIGEDVKSSGFGFSAEYYLGGGYTLGGNISQNVLKSLDDLTAQKYNVAFNTPEWRYNLKFGNRKVTDRLGFNLTYRWQEAYLWQSAIGSGVIPAFGTMDAQISYDIPGLKAKLKLGGSNITNNRYTTSYGNPRIGAVYYLQLNLSDLLN